MNRSQQNLSNPQIIDQMQIMIDDINDIERLAVLTVTAYMIQHMFNGPIRTDCDKIR